MEDDLNIFLDECVNDLWRECAIRSECDAVIEDDAVSRPIFDVNDWEEFARQTKDLIGDIGFKNLNFGVIAERKVMAVLFELDGGFEGCSQAIFP